MIIEDRFVEGMQITAAPTKKVREDLSVHQAAYDILEEHHMEILVNEQLFARLVCTSTDLENLVIGRMVSEGLITEAEEIESIYLCESGRRARVFLKDGTKNFDSARQEEPSCCTDNHIYLQGNPERVNEKMTGACEIAKEDIFVVIRAFSEDSKLHKKTGGTHSCLVAADGRGVVYSAEDLGRHNALDKAIGFIYREQLPTENCILFTTGRVPTDMMKKVITAKVPVLVSKAVPTKDAVELAKEYGILLICRAWPDSYEIFA